MNHKMILCLWVGLILCWPISSQTIDQFRFNIGFSRDFNEKREAKENFPVLVLEVNHMAFYKITKNNQWLEGGKLFPGRNRLGILIKDQYMNSATHVFSLAIKTESTVIEKQIEIEVTVIKPYIQSIENESSQTFELYLSHEDKIIATRKKHINRRIINEPKTIPYSPPTDGINPIDGSYPMIQKINVFGILKRMGEKKRQKEINRQASLLLYPDATYSYYMDTPLGGKKEAKGQAQIEIK